MSASILNWKDYFLQVSLILLSLFIAFGVDRCNEGVQNNTKLVSYLEAIGEELKYELETSKNNLTDCVNDVEDLNFAIGVFQEMESARLPEALGRAGQVFVRGVFRTFPPMNFELMNNSGDGLLLEDLELRRLLSAVATFRNDYVKADLMRHDELSLEALGQLSAYIDSYCLRSTEPEMFAQCITSLEDFRGNAVADLSSLHRHAELRAFHLQQYLKLLKLVIPEVQKAR